MSEQSSGDPMSEMEVAIDTPGVGAQLRAAREARGIQVQDVAATLKLGTRQVVALENGDWQALPGHTFIRGFVRNYARLVHLDPSPLMSQLDATLEKPLSSLGEVESQTTALPYQGGRISRRDRATIVIGAVLVALAGLVYFLLPNDLSALRGSAQTLLDSLSRKEAGQPATVAGPAASEPVFPPGATPQQVMNPQAEPSVAAEAAQVPAAASTREAPVASLPAVEKTATAVPLRFVFEKESWVEVRDRDNKVIFSQRSAAGLDQPLSGNGPFSLVIGYAPGVKLFWRGQPVDLVPHTRGDVARLVLE